MVEITATEQNTEKQNEKKYRQTKRPLKCTNIHIIGVPEGEERKKGPEKIFEEVIAENLPNMGKIQSTMSRQCRVPGRINPRMNTPRHIVIKLTKIKDRDKILKETRGK